jgi:hypothetical protein
MRRYPAERSGGGSRGGPDGADEGVPGATILIRNLATGGDLTFGNVAEFAWQDSEDGHLLAMLISAAGRIGNGVHLFDPVTAELRVLESSDADYSNLTWRDDAPDLAVLRSSRSENREGPTQVILAWTGLGSRREAASAYDPVADSAFPAGMRTVTWRGLSWSPDGTRLFFGIAEWEEKITPAGEEERGEGERGAG